MTGVDERRLIRGLKKGEGKSWKLLFDLFYAKFVNFAYTIVGDRSAAKDIVQNAFIRVWTYRERLEEDGSIENYIYVIVKRLVLNFLRDRKDYEDIASLGEAVSVDPGYDGVENRVMADETRLRIQNCVSNMPPQRRIVYVMSREQGLSNKDIATALGISVRTVDRHISLALADLRKNFS